VVEFNKINFIGDDSTEAHNDGSTVKNGMNVSGNFGRDVVWSGLRCCQTCMNNPCVIAVGRKSAVSTTGSANSGESEGPFTQRRLASNSRAALQRLDTRAGFLPASILVLTCIIQPPSRLGTSISDQRIYPSGLSYCNSTSIWVLYFLSHCWRCLAWALYVNPAFQM
jgi:hypothetical protein